MPCLVGFTHWGFNSFSAHSPLTEKYWWLPHGHSYPTNWNQVFQSLPWPLVYKGKHLGMQTVSTNICLEWVTLRSSVNSSVVGCHLYNQSSHEISLILNIPQSTVSGIITKWGRLGTTATQPQSGRPCKMTEWGQRMLRRIVHRGCQLSVKCYRPQNFMWPSDYLKQLHPNHTSARAKQSVRCSGVKHTTTGL